MVHPLDLRSSKLVPALVAVVAAAALGGCASRRAAASPPPAEGPGAPGAMVRLPGGTFLAGALTGPRNDTPTYHTVRPFLLDVTEVTVAGYSACVAAGACRPAPTTVAYSPTKAKARWAPWERVRSSELAAASAHCNDDRADRADHPVNCVAWSDAKDYCAWAGKRLPSEEEWEWAARNGKGETLYPWGDEPPADRACWNGEGNGAGAGKQAGTCAVGSHPTGDSQAGVKDLGGNVWEWTSSESVVFADSVGRGGTPVKVARGGSWTDVDARNVSAILRFLEVPSARRSDLGFRCAKRP